MNAVASPTTAGRTAPATDAVHARSKRHGSATTATRPSLVRGPRCHCRRARPVTVRSTVRASTVSATKATKVAPGATTAAPASAASAASSTPVDQPSPGRSPGGLRRLRADRPVARAARVPAAGAWASRRVAGTGTNGVVGATSTRVGIGAAAARWSMATRAPAGGRRCGSAESAAASTGASRGSTPARSGRPCRTRSSTTSSGPVPNGDRPDAANASVEPQPHQSVAGVTGHPATTSGDRYPGVPMTRPARVSRVSSARCAMPKSMSTGSPSSSSTLAGLTSRCTTPAAWIAVSACASTTPMRATSAMSSGPWLRTCSSSVRPGTNRVAR